MKKECPILVIEGGDASGKTLQTQKLAERLRSNGLTVEIFNFPQYEQNMYGKIIRAYLNGEFGQAKDVDPFLASVLYCMDRAETVPQIEAAMQHCDVILMNRYYSANYIHQAAKIADNSKRIDLIRRLSRLEFEILNIPKARQIFYLHVLPEVSQRLMEAQGRVKDQHEDDINYAKRVEETALWLCNTQTSTWTLIECCPDGETILTPEEINEKLYHESSFFLK